MPRWLSSCCIAGQEVGWNCGHYCINCQPSWTLFLVEARQDKQDKHLARFGGSGETIFQVKLDSLLEQARQAGRLDQEIWKRRWLCQHDRLQKCEWNCKALTPSPSEMTGNLLQTRTKTDQRLQALQESNEQRWNKCVRQSRKSWKRPCRRACRLPSEPFPNN